MRHDLLDPHRIIAWDMDETLIQNPNSAFFRNYIKAHPEKEHHIVTFRDPDWADEAPYELAQRGLSPQLITAVHACPQEYYRAYAMAHVDAVEWARLAPQTYQEAVVLTKGPLFSVDDVNAYLHWKGKKAAEIGATILVDDNWGCCIMGCEKHGITFVNSHDTRFKPPPTMEPLLGEDEWV